MQRGKGQRYTGRKSTAAIEDSPTIKNLIEKLNKDLEEAVRDTSKPGQSSEAA